MKQLLIILGMTLCMTEGHAQDFQDYKKKTHGLLDDFRNEVHADLESFRKKCWKEFLDFMENPWKEFKEEPVIPKPKDEDIPPVLIPKDELDKPIDDRPIVIDEVIKPLPINPQPLPIEPIKEDASPDKSQKVRFEFFGTQASVRFDVKNRIHLKGIDEKSVVEALRGIVLENYDNMLIDCLGIRKERHLSDWAYLLMLRSLSEAIAGGENNDATLTLAFLYVQSGYKMRLGSDGSKLYLLFATDHHVYDMKGFVIGTEIFYAFDEHCPDRLFISDVAFPKEQGLSLIMPDSPKFDIASSNQRKITSIRYPDIQVQVSCNKNLIDFYSTYPTSMLDMKFMTRWAMYANTPMDEYVSKQFYPILKKKLEGLSQIEAVERLLNFVQTGFVYEYDNKVWGCDRAFFAEESLFYPFCDCEDRSILLTRLVRDLLGLKCILIYYPGHLASAVEFTEGEVKGDYIQLENHRYVITDGTYIGASVGRTMPGMDNKTAKAILLK